MKKIKNYLKISIIVILVFMAISHETYKKSPTQHILAAQKECRLCGNGKNSLKNIYKNLHGIGVLCLNDWRMVDILTSNDAAISSNSSSCIWAEKNAYSIEVTRIVPQKISFMQYTDIKNTPPDMDKLNSFLCHACMKNIKETLHIYGSHKNRTKKAVCMVAFPTMELYGLQHDFQYYLIGDYYAQAYCIDNEISLTVFFSPEISQT